MDTSSLQNDTAFSSFANADQYSYKNGVEKEWGDTKKHI
jgi:hypothetical protein